ncbi:MAG: hypothetical protein GEU28_00645 [Dehalococcoidia bacterium]|nr:hypothetical protein [Dehalococcoidia bacterium]
MKKDNFISAALGGMLVVVFLTATSVLAGNGIGAVFNLGQFNRVNATSVLTGSPPPGRELLRIDNNGQAAAMRLEVPFRRPPFTTNSRIRVPNLNADMVDGAHGPFLREAGYRNIVQTTGNGGANQTVSVSVACDPGDQLLSGGYYGVEPATRVLASFPEVGEQWVVSWRNGPTPDFVGVVANCTDLR